MKKTLCAALILALVLPEMLMQAMAQGYDNGVYAQTTRLYDMDYFTKDRFNLNPGSTRDNYGGEYDTELYATEGSIDYYLGGKYSELSGTLFVTERALSTGAGCYGHMWDQVTFNVYCDDTMVYSKKGLDARLKPLDLLIDIRGVEFLRLEFKNNYFIDSGMHTVLAKFGSAMLTKGQTNSAGSHSVTEGAWMAYGSGNTGSASPAVSSPSPRWIMKAGDTGSGVRALQERLIELGYLGGEADGYYGTQTERAISAFQQKNGIGGVDGCDGVATFLTMDRLFMDKSYISHTFAAWDGGSADAPGNGQYAISVGNDFEISPTGIKGSYAFRNDSGKTVKAVVGYYWTGDQSGRPTGGKVSAYASTNVISAPSGGWATVNYQFNFSEDALRSMDELDFCVLEILYDDGTAYVNCNPKQDLSYNYYYRLAWQR